MVVPFGFSVGDFISTLELVGTVIAALRSAGGSSDRYRELVDELYTLEKALIRVKNLKLDDSQEGDVQAVRQAASQCQKTIDKFWKKIAKYQQHLSAGGSGSRVKDSWMKIQWALCTREDVDAFRADIRGHIAAIEMLLMIVQMYGSTSHFRYSADWC